jgi:hypothetical protein
MLKQAKRITYAQKKILDMIETRTLRQWCLDNGLPHSTVYRMGTGILSPTYKMVCSMVHLIAPVEWLYYIGEKMPYEEKLVQKWDPLKPSKFIKMHKYDYKEVSKKYGLSELQAYNICVASRVMPSLAFIRACCVDTNPIDFFIDGEGSYPKEITKFYPDRGDIVNIKQRLVVVLSKKEQIEKTGYLACTPIFYAKSVSCVPLIGTGTKGFVQGYIIETFHNTPKCKISYVETVPKSVIKSILDDAKKVFTL